MSPLETPGGVVGFFFDKSGGVVGFKLNKKYV